MNVPSKRRFGTSKCHFGSNNRTFPSFKRPFWRNKCRFGGSNRRFDTGRKNETMVRDNCWSVHPAFFESLKSRQPEPSHKSLTPNAKIQASKILADANQKVTMGERTNTLFCKEMNRPFLQSLKDCGVGLIVATATLMIGSFVYNPELPLSAKSVLGTGLCCAVVIAVVGLPISYASRRIFTPSANKYSSVIFGSIGFVLSQAILFLILFIISGLSSGKALEITLELMYESEWRMLTVAFAVTGGVIGALSLNRKDAEQSIL